MVQAFIWCGGRGLRAYPLTSDLPKPMLALGGVPVLRHIMDIYVRQGIGDFVIAAGFRAELIESYVRDLPRAYRAEVIDTGLDSGTGLRLQRCLDRLDQTFHATYGDGLADIDLAALRAAHERHNGATVTAVAMPSQYGTLDLRGDRVIGFSEKPVLKEVCINAGFFMFERAVVAQFVGASLEEQMLPALADAGRLHVFRHDGFWRTLDTYKDHQELAALARCGAPPWLR